MTPIFLTRTHILSLSLSLSVSVCVCVFHFHSPFSLSLYLCVFHSLSRFRLSFSLGLFPPPVLYTHYIFLSILCWSVSHTLLSLSLIVSHPLSLACIYFSFSKTFYHKTKVERPAQAKRDIVCVCVCLCARACVCRYVCVCVLAYLGLLIILMVSRKHLST